MTTRKNKLLKMLGYNSDLNQLQSLSHDDALSLFALHALGVNNFDSHLSLRSHGIGIMKKCDGLTLALKALGRLLSTQKDEEEYWKKVLDSEIWRLPVEGEIIPALRLSYRDLSAKLKQLFAYCSLFPKDHVFDKEELIQLWMVEGFLHLSTPIDSPNKCLGHEYFDELLSRSFFQHSPNNKSLFVMHDMMNELATFVAGEFCVRLGRISERKHWISTAIFHLFVRISVAYNKLDAIKRAKSLRTFLVMSVGVVKCWQYFYLSNKILVDLFLELPLLRVLCLSDFKLCEVPESIDTLKHLRYLNLSQTEIKHVPENVSDLFNLQTLILFGCHSLAKLPYSFLKLKNLRHLDIRDTPLLEKMPLGIGELESLRTLSKVIIGVEGGIEITKLKYLKNLCGKISIVGLDKVENAIHAREANISQKRLSELELVWNDYPFGSRDENLEKEVLNELKPPNDCLKQLEIVSYGGLEFLTWVGDPLFLRLKHVSIRGCKSCTSLPLLGQLPSLKELFIERLHVLKVVGLELLGTSRAFPSLEILSFKNMPWWEKWSMNSGVVFPHLQQLHIKDCPNLVEFTLEAMPSLNIPKVNECDSGVLRRLLEMASAVAELKISLISGLNDVVWRGVIEYLGAVEDLNITFCNEIRYLWESEAVASKALVNLRNLRVAWCGNLVSLGQKEEDNCKSSLLTSLRMLDVSHCNNMERCTCPDSIEILNFQFCDSITTIHLPTGGKNLKSLANGVCKKLKEREWGGQKINNRSTVLMLEYVSIIRWPNLHSIIKLNHFDHLTRLSIESCESLESFSDHELPNLTLLKYLKIIKCPSIDASFPRGFWPPNLHTLGIGKLKKPILEWDTQNFPSSLVELKLYGEDGVSSCSQLSHLLPSSLTSLEIIEFEKLGSFSTGLQHLTFLQHLSFLKCPNMMELTEMLLASLLSFRIINCPNLKERCSEDGCYWPHISHIPCIEID